MTILDKDIFKGNWSKYRELGLTPYPASKTGKRPIPAWKGNPSFNNDDFQNWEEEYPAENIWVRLGDQFAVIDPDGPGAEEFVQSLNLPECPTSISGNKSIHRWFRVSSPIKPIKALNGHDQTFLEVRTGNMGMLVPPSIHPATGKPYKWIEGLSPWDIPFPELPEEAYEKIRALTQKPEPKMEPAQPENTYPGSLDVKRYLDSYEISYQIKQDRQRTIYALGKCLFADGHTTKDGLGDASLIQGPDGKVSYHCFHNHCASKTWQDARKAISGDEPLTQFCHDEGSPTESKQESPVITYKSVVLSADEIMAMDFPEKRKILNPWLSEQTIVLVAGWRGIGKTWFGLSVADAISRGMNFGPWETITPVPCLYVDGEMAIQDIKERLGALDGSAGQKRKEPLLFYSDYYANFLKLPKANLLNAEWREHAKETCLEREVKLIVLDNLSSLTPGIDENSKQEWDPINQWLLDLRFNGISVIMLHHTNKGGGQRGTSGREDNIDMSILLENPSDYVIEDGCRFIPKFSKGRIKTADLPLITEVEFHLREKDGRLIWVYGPTKSRNKKKVLRLLSQDVPQNDIAKQIGISEGTVSKIKKSLIADGCLDTEGDITEKGEVLLDDD